MCVCCQIHLFTPRENYTLLTGRMHSLFPQSRYLTVVKVDAVGNCHAREHFIVCPHDVWPSIFRVMFLTESVEEFPCFSTPNSEVATIVLQVFRELFPCNHVRSQGRKLNHLSSCAVYFRFLGTWARNMRQSRHPWLAQKFYNEIWKLSSGGFVAGQRLTCGGVVNGNVLIV
jgi:hypothetical protein